MNLFDAFPVLANSAAPPLSERDLRLIGLSALLYDDRAFYFELADSRFWVMPPTAPAPLIGVGGAQCAIVESQAPATTLVRHLRHTRRIRAEYPTNGHTYVLEADVITQLPAAPQSNLPYLLILTPPRLGGGDEVPDALAQAVYLLPLSRALDAPERAGLLRIERAALGEFLAQQTWPLSELLAQPWATFDAPTSLPEDASLRLVLALRGLRTLWQAGEIILEGQNG